MNYAPHVSLEETADDTILRPSRKVRLIFFAPTLGFWSALARLFDSQDWEDVLKDPYLLINSAFEAWYDLIDNISWGIVDRIRETEKASAVTTAFYLKLTKLVRELSRIQRV
jgi:hypothetical protein